MQLSASWRWGDLAHIVVADTRQYRTDQWDPIVGSELCGTSVTSGGDGSDAYENVTENPKRRGYVRVTLTANELRADVRQLAAVTTPNAPASTGASFTLTNGRPGLQA